MSQDKLLESLYSNICEQIGILNSLIETLQNFFSFLPEPKDWEPKLWQIELKMSQFRNFFLCCQDILKKLAYTLGKPSLTLKEAAYLSSYEDFVDKQIEWQKSILVCHALLQDAYQASEFQNNVAKKLIEIYSHTATATYNSKGIFSLENRHAAL